MNPKKILLHLSRSLTLVAALLTIAPVSAQSSATGTVEGRVLNVTSGQYVKNARVTVEGTNLESLTNEFGEYRLTEVPIGSATIRASYGGLPPVAQSVAVAAGQNTTQNFSVGGGTQSAQDGAIVKLDEFVVASAREMNAAAIATNEQRYAPNIKNVVSADAFGDVTEGNVGEFLKYLPGISVDYVAADVRTVSVRGFADTFTGVNVDGGRMASAVSGNANRVFELEQVSINNVARVEVTKVPTPEMPADGIGGSVNMISRSAFELTRPQFRYKLNLSLHSENRSDLFKRTPGPGEKKTFKNLPGFEFNYINPVSKTFGIVINGLTSNQFNEQHRSLHAYNYNAAGTGASLATPYLQNYTLQDGPKNSFRDSLAITADWKPLPRHVISIRGQANYYKSFFGNRNINWGAGTNPAPTVAGAQGFSFSPEFTQGALGRGTVTHGTSFRDKLGATTGINFTHKFNGEVWSTESGLNTSHSRTWYRDITRGHFAGVSTTMQGVFSVRYDDITYPAPGSITVRDATGAVVDSHALANYRINNATSTATDGEALNKGAYANIKRTFDIGGFPLALKTGAAIRSEDRDNRRNNETYTFVGRDGMANSGDDSAAAFVDEKYSGENPYWGFRQIQWPDPYKLYQAFRSNPTYFSTATTAVTNETNRINGSEKFREVITAGFIQAETNLFRNRLRIVTGVRWEETDDRGEGPLFDPDAAFQRDAAGRFVLVNGARVRRPEAGAAGSLQDLSLTRRERAGRGRRTYDGYYPSFHSTYNVTENLLFRFAYAKTFGRPDFVDIIPNTTIDEADVTPAPGAPLGTITVRNPGLEPWTAQNYDVSIEYYFERGGLVSVSGFQKNISNFWNAVNTILTPELASELGVEQDYVGWTVISRTNGGDSKISGLEANANQPLTFIPGWGKHFSLSANITRLHLEGSRAADFARFIPRTGNIGLTFNRRPFNVKVNYNYRGQQKISAVTAINGFRYYKERKYLDVNFEYQFSRRATFFLNGRNITNVPQDRLDIGANAAYSTLNQVEEFGVQWGLGIKGTF
jgi:iron complex outermembrane receptor protein